MKFQRISVKKANELIKNDPTLTIADIRDEESFNCGNIKDSVHINNSSIKSFLQSTSKDSPLLIYCYHGNSSLQAAEYFVSEGFTNVYSMDGGFAEYKQI